MKNNKKLVVVLGVLVAIFALTRLLKDNSKSKVFKKDLVSIAAKDIESVDIIKPSGTIVMLSKEMGADNWSVKYDDVTTVGNKDIIDGFLEMLESLKADRLVSKKSEKWSKYDLTDSTATIIKVTDNDASVKLYIGKTKVQPNGNNIYAGTTNASYVRVEGDKNTYLIKSVLTTMMDNDPTFWRNNTFIKSQPDDIQKLTFKHKATNFELSKTDSSWVMNAKAIDEALMETYLKQYSSKKITEFGDDFSADASPEYEVMVSGSDIADFKLSGYEANDSYYIVSSLNPKVFFKTTQAYFKKIFVTESHFLSN